MIRIWLLLLLFCTVTIQAQELVRVEADPDKGFFWPYYYSELEVAPKAKNRTILVLPNNSGKCTDDFQVQERDARKATLRSIPNFTKANLPVVILRPVFPRPKSQGYCYTHALDRDTMLTRRRELERLDLQLVAMIEDLKRRSQKKLDEKILMAGFSASGMFVNRFCLLHPKRVKAAAIGSPGGWPIAPTAQYQGKALPYPVGTFDFQDICGRDFDLQSFQRLPLLIFMGDQDENDSVDFRDGYDHAHADLVDQLFGPNPVSRWESSKKLYRDSGSSARFRLYTDVGHTITESMAQDIAKFLKSHI